MRRWTWSRRAFVVNASLGLATACTAVHSDQNSAAVSAIMDIEKQLGGRVGISVLTDNRAAFSYRGNERFAMCSTFKLLLAARILASVDRGVLSLEQRIAFGASDLLPVSPVTTAHVGEDSLSVEELAQAIVEVSDNAAANMLLAISGGPSGLTDFLRQNGDRLTRLDRNEPSLNTNLPGDPRDTTTPDAMTATMHRLLVGEVLLPGSRQRLLGWMQNCKTGLKRIRAGLPVDWQAGDKTGTGANGATNDLAIIWPSNHAPILVAIFMSDSTVSPDTLEAAHARIGSIVSQTFT